jgi:VCBS repeat-containing protein
LTILGPTAVLGNVVKSVVTSVFTKMYLNKIAGLPVDNRNDDPVALLNSVNTTRANELGLLEVIDLADAVYSRYSLLNGGSTGVTMLHSKALYVESLIRTLTDDTLLVGSNPARTDFTTSDYPTLDLRSYPSDNNDLMRVGTEAIGGGGNDVMVAGASTTLMAGESGVDAYVVKGAGSDITLAGDHERQDHLYFNMDGDITAQVNGEALELTISGPSGSRKVIIPNWYSGNGVAYQLYEIGKIAPVSVVSQAALTQNGSYYNQTDLAGRNLTALAIPFLNEGGGLSDVVFGSFSSDVMHGFAGDDTMSGRDGNDIIYGDAGNDLIEGGAGNDTIVDNEGFNTIVGGAGDDGITASHSVVDGGEGSDTLTANMSGLSSFYGSGNSYAYNNGLYYRNAANAIVSHGSSLETVETFQGDGSGRVDVYNGVYDAERAFGLLASWQGLEKVSVTGTNQTGDYEGNDLLMVKGSGGTYNGGSAANYDTLYANWSAATAAISWDSSITAEQTLYSGTKVQGIERVLLRLGAGNDVIKNTNATSDQIYADAGNDSISLGSGANFVDGGDGSDVIAVLDSSNWNTIQGGAGDDVLTGSRGSYDGGAGVDTLTANMSGLSSFYGSGNSYAYNNGLYYRNAANAIVSHGSSLETVETFQGDGSGRVDVYNGVYDAERAFGLLASWQGLEKVSVTGTNQTGDYEGNDLLMVKGSGGTYNGGSAANYDTLYANWSAATAAISWDSSITAEQTLYSGTKVQGIERVLLRLGAGNDVIKNTNATSDQIYADAGNDSISLGSGANFVDGGDGSDVIAVLDSSNWNTIQGGAGDDVLTGSRGSYDGGAGVDTLTANMSGLSSFYGSGNSYAYNNGLYYRNAANAIVSHGSSLETVETFQGDGSGRVDVYNGVYDAERAFGLLASWQGLEKVSVTGTNQTGDYEGNDLLMVKGSGGTYNGGSAANYDTLYANWSAATAAISWDSSITAEQTLYSGTKVQGIERVLLRLGAGNDVIKNTNATSDQIYADAGNDSISLGSGANFVDGGDGSDVIAVLDSSNWNTIQGGAGDDVLTGSRGSYDGGAGVDTLTANMSGLSSFYGSGNSYAYNNGLYYRNAANAIVSHGSSLETVETFQGDGSGRVDVYNGVYDAERAFGLLASWQGLEKVSVTGTNQTGDYEGNDLLMVKGSGGTYNGGSAANYDTLYANWSAATATINWDNNTGGSISQTINGVTIQGVERLLLRMGSGDDIIRNSSYAAGDQIIAGAGNDQIYTGAGSDLLKGDAGNDLLDGGAGADRLEGGVGNDSYYVDSVGDVVVELAGNGVDKVFAAASYVLGENLEALTLTTVADINGTGNSGGNTLTGNDGNNTLDGGAGADTLSGGLGNDVYIVDDAGDVVTELDGQGTDIIQSSVSFTLVGGFVENLTLTGIGANNATGNALNNVLTGNGAANTLDGGAGADAMSGGAGDDTYKVDNTADSIFENASAGTDTVESTVTYTLVANVENLTLTGAAAINGVGNALNNLMTGNSGVNTLTGGLGNDTYVVNNSTDTVVENAAEGSDTVQTAVTYTLGGNVENLTLTGTANISGTGNELNNVILGNSGNNTLNGGLGNDTLTGGIGNDVYVVDSTGDIVSELLAEGTDTVQARISYTLSANVENLTILGAEALNGTGNNLNNVLTGNSANNSLTGGEGNDTLNGGTGADTLAGGAGNDIYTVDSTADVVTENVNEGVDTVNAGISYTLGANIESLTLTGSLDINATGNAQANTLTANSGNNSLDGGAGADTLAGGVGNDTYMIDNVADTVIELLGEGADAVLSTVSYVLGDNVESLTLNGSASLDGTGNGLDNSLTGNSANNRLDGGGGADTLTGYAGNDLYIVDHAADVVIEQSNEGVDTVESSVGFTLGVNIENLVLTGSSIINGVGNALNNILTGNNVNNSLTGGAGNDTLDGSGGVDTAVYSGNWKDFSLSSAAGVTTVTSLTETDTLTNIENLRFNGIVVSLVNAVNDGPVAVNDNNSGDAVMEAKPDTAADATAAGNVISNDTDADLSLGLGETLTVSGVNGSSTNIGVAVNGIYGRLVLNANGGYVYTLDDADADTNALSTGQTVNDVFNYVVKDAHGATSSATLSISIAGVTDSSGPQLNAPSAIQYTDTKMDDVFATATGTLTASQVSSGAVLTYGISGGVANANGTVSKTGLYGTLTVSTASGAYSFVANDSAIEPLSANATEKFTVSVSLGAQTSSQDLVVNIASASGTETNGNDALLGTTAKDAMLGLGGNDTLDGGAGADTLTGGLGNDTYIVDNTGDVVTELLNEGTDTVQASVSYTLGANVERLVLTGATNISGVGNDLANTLTGNSGNNRLNGGAGADTLNGGLGNDTYVVETSGETLIEAADAGTDTVETFLTWTLGANLENLTLNGSAAINGYGNSLNNVITGNSGGNTLRGNGGTDTLTGGAGDDRYYIDSADDIVTELAAEGSDFIYSTVSLTLGANLERLYLQEGFATALNATGNSLANNLTGNSLGNILEGGGGDDALGGRGGNDTYYVDSGKDIIEEFVGDGTDEVYSSASFSLRSNVEHLTLTGTAVSGIGNLLNNRLTGNASDNVLKGGGGTDTMTGGLGNDTYYVDTLNDVVTELAGEGTDYLYSTVSLTLGENLERLYLLEGSATALEATGNSLNNAITGNSLNNVLRGGGGADTLTGRGGNDRYYVDSTDDIVEEYVGEGTDEVYSSVSLTLRANVENLRLTGVEALNGRGNELANVLTGNSGANLLTGGLGNDTYTGSRGMGVDTVVENDSTAGNTDVLNFLTGVAHTQLWFTHAGNNLEVSIIGTNDKAVVKDWYLGRRTGWSG